MLGARKLRATGFTFRCQKRLVVTTAANLAPAQSAAWSSSRSDQLALAWGWFIGGWLKGVTAGAVVGRLLTDSRGHEQRTG
jgi:hypothetical protein